jgi:hypothetical protein
MHRFTRATVALSILTAAAAVACSEPLEVENANNPQRGSVLNLPRDVEALASKLYQNVHNASFGSGDALYTQMNVMSYENVSSLANFGMGPRSNIPRGPVDNTPGNATATGTRRDFQQLQNAARTASTIFEAINADGFTTGNATQNARLRAFTWFGYGVALGNVALAYDSAAIPRPGDGENTPPLVAYDSVMRSGLRALDSAQAIAASASFTTTIPSGWLAQSSDMSAANFVRLIRAYKARLRAGVARTPADRGKVDWAAVVADAQAGLASDFVLQLSPTAGWDVNWLASHFTTGAANWHQMTPYIIGMADTSGAFDAWLATPRDSRSAFLIRTPDQRFPAGDTRATQQANSPATPTNAKLYFRNRASGEDQPGNAWAVSQYDHNRWRPLFAASRVGAWTTFSQVENDMLAAVGLIRLGRVTEATPLIDASRVRNGLPALTGVVTTATQSVPGGSACVPRVPDPAKGYTATKCGDVLEAMKWEKRMESAYAGWSVWYMEGRGWGDLPEGTAVHFPVPYQERDARGVPAYLLGGVGKAGGAAASTTYGYGTGTR